VGDGVDERGFDAVAGVEGVVELGGEAVEFQPGLGGEWGFAGAEAVTKGVFAGASFSLRGDGAFGQAAVGARGRFGA
jgi:hypothetical protein